MIILFHLIRIVFITSPECQAMAVQYTGHVISVRPYHGDNDTALMSLAEVLVT